MSHMWFRLSQALSSGRKARSVPVTREMILADLLEKRATAARSGLTDLEAQLRNQIRWALPIKRPDETGQPDESPSTPGSDEERDS